MCFFCGFTTTNQFQNTNMEMLSRPGNCISGFHFQQFSKALKAPNCSKTPFYYHNPAFFLQLPPLRPIRESTLPPPAPCSATSRFCAPVP